MLKINNNKIIGVIGKNRDIFIKDLMEEKNINQVIIYDDMLVKDILKSSKLEEVIKMVGLTLDVLDKSIDGLSESEITKVKIAYYLILNDEYIVLDDYLDILDNRNKTKIFKILLKLKKYYNKTIIVSSSNINNIFELIDEIVYCGKTTIYDNKIDIYKNNIIDEVPDIIEFASIIKKRYNIEYKDSINELIKELYRKLR